MGVASDGGTGTGGDSPWKGNSSQTESFWPLDQCDSFVPPNHWNRGNSHAAACVNDSMC